MLMKIYPIVAILGVAVFLLFVSPWLIYFVLMWMSPNPPKPKVLHGEFPVHLKYEINGQMVTVDDTVICDYDGVGMNEGVGKYNKWKERLTSSGNEEITLLKINKNNRIYFDVGSANYYMGVKKEYDGDNVSEASIINSVGIGSMTSAGAISAEELWQKYKIKIIDWKHSDPIKQE